jgi:TP901 family phage tail tape measure protein
VALSTRELYLVLRAKNEATSALNAMGRDLDRARASAELMGAQSAKAHHQAEQAAARNSKAHAEYAQRQLEAQKATQQAQVAYEQARQRSIAYATAVLEQQKATQQATLATTQQRQALDQNGVALLQNAKAHNDVRIAQLRSQEGSGEQIRTLNQQNLMLRDQINVVRDGIIARQNDVNAQRAQINSTQEQINHANQLGHTYKANILNAQTQVRATNDQIRAQREVVSNMRIEIADRQAMIQSIDREIAAIKKSNQERSDANARLRQSGQEMTSVGTATAASGAIALTGIYKLTQAAVDYEKATALTRSQVDDTGVSLKQLGDIGLQVARDFGVPFESIQKSFYDIFSSMDVNVPQAESLLRNFSKAAIAGGTDMQTAGRLVISQLNAFKIPVEDVGRVLDVQFKLVQKGVGTYEEFARSLGRAQPSAVRAGQSIETLSGMMAILTRAGLTVYNATASAGRALDLFANAKVVERLKDMGINARDASGNFRPLADVVVELQQKFATMDAPTRAKEMEALFKGSGNNIQARRFWDLVLATDAGAKGFKDMVGQMEQSGGTLESKYGQMADTMAVRNEKMKNQWKALQVTLGEDLFPVIEKLINGLSRLAEWYNNLSPGQQSFLAWAVTIGAALTVVAGVVLVFAGALTMVAGVLGIAAGALGIIVVAVGAFIAAWILAYNKVEWFHDAVNGYVRALVAIFNWLKDATIAVWNAIVDLLQAAWRDIQTIWDALKAAARAIGDAWNWLKGVAESAWNGIKSAIAAAGDFLQGIWNAIMVGVHAVGAVFQWLLDAVRPIWNAMKLAADIWWAAMQVMFGLVQIALKALAAAWGVMGDMIAAVWNKIREWTSAAWNFVKSVLDAWITFMKVQFAQAWDWISDKISAIWTAIRNAAKAAWDWLNQNVFQPIINMLRGPLGAAWDWISDKISAAWTAIRNASSTAWNWVKDNVFEPLRNIITNTIPNAFETGVRAISSAWNRLQDAAMAPVRFVVNTVLNDGLLAGYNTIARAFNVKPDDVQIKRLAIGGAVHGPGGPTDDKVPAMLSAGEHVWTAKEVRKAGGQQAMYRMRNLVNEGRAKFAAGGAVDGMNYPAAHRGDGPLDWVTGLVGGLNPLAGAALDATLSNPAVVLNKFMGMLNQAGSGNIAKIAIAAGKKAIEGALKWIGEKIGFGSGDAGSGKFNAQPNGWPAHTGNQPPWSPNVAAAAGLIRGLNPGMSVGSYVSGSGWSDHFPKAIDAMTSAHNPQGLARGNGIAKWFIEHPGAYGTKYVIWNKRITSGQGWGPYSVPGQGDHSDHVHLSFYKKGGAVAQQLMDRGGMLQPGMTSIVNNTGVAERVLSASQTQSFDRLVQLLDSQDTTSTAMSGLAPTGGRGRAPVTVNIYTQELDPRRHAMQLGMELDKVIG